MSNIDKQALRDIAEKTKIAGEAPVMPFEQRINALNDFMKHFTPATVLALLDELEAAEKRGDKISLDYDTLADKANIIVEQRDELIIRNHEMAELLINLKKARPGGVYFNKWDTQIDSVLRAAAAGKGE